MFSFLRHTKAIKKSTRKTKEFSRQTNDAIVDPLRPKYQPEQQFRRKHFPFFSLNILLLTGTFLLPFEMMQPQRAFAASCSTGVINRTSSPVFYIDTGITPSVVGNYVSYTITNTSGSAYTDLWVKLESFSGDRITLAAGETGIAHVGSLANGASKTVFFYLANTAGTGDTTTAQSHIVSLYSTRPDLASSSICGNPFSQTVEETIKAVANKVTAVVAGPNPPELGGIMTITATGDTGTIGAAGIFAPTPASFANWPANAYKLVGTQITFKGGNTGTFNNILYKSGLNSTNTSYEIIYTFVAAGVTASTSVTPVTQISSGTQIKHNDTGTSLLAILPSTNKVTLTKSVSSTALPVGGTVTYTITLNNTGAVATTLDDIIDILPSSPTNASYISGSAKFNSSTISNPNISGQTLTFLGLFTVPAGGTSTLTYQVTIPNTIGTYTNSAIGHIGSTQIDTTLTTTDNMPATATVQIAPLGISGTVFEDPNYGGGAGRPLSTPTTSPRDGATVELYKQSDGSYVRNTTTSGGGKYTFSGVSADDYFVRVVNSTVTASRGTGSVLPVQTFRIDKDASGVPTADPNRVGGEKPSEVDAPANSGSQTLATLNALANQEVQSIAPVKVSSSAVTGIDFGYNFDTIVNTNNSGQGSLRQFITNANALDNTGLIQAGQPQGKEVSIFMIPNGAGTPGLRAGLSNQLTSGVAIITLTAALPTITGADTSLDATTQTNNVGDTNLGTQGTVGTVGTSGTILPTFSKPEVELKLFNALTVTGNNVLLRGLAIYGGSGDTIRWSGNSGGIIDQNFIGTTASSFSDPGAGNRTSGNHISLGNSLTNLTITNNLIGFAFTGGISLVNGQVDTLLIQGNQIDRNNRNIISGGLGAGIEIVPFDGAAGSYAKNVMIQRNLITGQTNDHGIEYAVGSLDTGLLIDNNTISNNERGLNIRGSGTNPYTISSNIITGNIGNGIQLGSVTSKTLTKNSTYANGSLGIDLAGDGVSANNGSVNSAISNSGMNYPVIVSSTLSNGTLTVKGYVGNNTATSNANFGLATLEFFVAADDGNQNGAVLLGDGRSKSHGEGKTYIGSCNALANSSFVCNFTNPVIVGIDPLNITATATGAVGTAVAGNTSEFSATPYKPANVIMVKRITGIRHTGASSFGPTNPNDGKDLTSKDNTNPLFPSDYIVGAEDGGKIIPGDEVEYTVYYLNNGENAAVSVHLCDRLDSGLAFMPSSYGAGLGTQLKLGDGSIYNLTNAIDSTTIGDRGQFIAPGTPAAPNLLNSTTQSNCHLSDNTNPRGTISIDLTGTTGAPSLPSIPGILRANTVNVPSYGSFKFVTQVLAP